MFVPLTRSPRPNCPIVKPNKSLPPEELIEAERLWIVHAQTQLKGERDFNTWQKQFNLFPDDKGLIRCSGRLENATLPYSTKYPLLLPRKASLHHSDCKKCSQSCFSQWSEGDPDRDSEEVLDSQGTQSSEVNNPLLCHLQAT